MNRSNQTFTCRILFWASVVLVSMAGCSALVGWIFDLSILKSLDPSFPEMRPNAAIALIFAAIALACSSAEKIKGQWWIGKLSALVVILFGLIPLAKYCFALGLNTDPARIGDPFPSGIPCNTSFCFVLAGLALLILDRKTRRSIVISQGATFVVGFLCLIVFLGYVFGISALYSFPATTHFRQMPLHAAIALSVLVIGIFSSRPDQGLMTVLMSPRPGGIVARRLLLAILYLPVLVSLLLVTGVRLGAYDLVTATFALVVSVIAVLAMITWRAAIVLNVLDEKKTDLAHHLLEMNHKFERLVTGVKDFEIIILDPKGRITTWGQGAEKLTGYKAAEIIGEHFSKFYLPEDAMAGLPDRELKEAEAYGQITSEGWFVRKDGTRYWGSCTLTPMKTPDGVLIGFSKVARDLTGRRRYEDQLRLAETTYRGLLDTAFDALVNVNEAGLITRVNQKAEAIFGYKRLELIAQPMEILLPERLRTAYIENFKEYLVHPTLRLGELHDLFGRRKDGTEFPIEIYPSPLKTEHGVIISFTIQDITKWHIADKVKEVLLKREKNSRIHAEETAELRDKLVVMVSHDFKGPLSSILLAARLMKSMSPVEEKWRRPLEMITQSAEQLSEMVHNLLDTHRIEAGQIKLTEERGSHDVLSIIQVALERQEFLLRQKKLRLETTIPDELPMISVDAGRIQQVLQNLIGNAIKFTPDGGSIRIRAESLGSEVKISVSDTGPGISESLRKRLFGRFVQSGEGKKTGTGLGLSIAKAIVDAHGGKIWVESQVGVGSTFFFTLPTTVPLKLEA
jgi:PAS domain S-box-containing protein